MKSLESLDLKNKTVLLRLNLNVPIENGKIQDDFRIRVVMPTIEYCMQKAEKTVIIAHLGRPEGKDPKYTLHPVAEYIEKLLGSQVIFVKDCIGDGVESSIKSSPKGTVFLLENLRFHEGEMNNDKTFAKELAKLGDVYINDAFGDNAKATASVDQLPKLLPHAAGFRLLDEIKELSRLHNPRLPFSIIIGGKKIKEKMGVISQLGEKADYLLLAGGVANTILYQKGFQLYDSLVSIDELECAKKIIRDFDRKLVLPVDVGVAKKQSEGTFLKQSFTYVPIGGLSDGQTILDIGPQTFDLYQDVLSRSQTIFWAGPLGMIEWKPSAKYSIQLARLLAGYACDTFLGGGDTAALLAEAGVDPKEIDFISTGGSASLQFLAGKDLPGISALG